ncbi:MAG TPA: T9SS type A sorting domain-containing protein, partial [Bacteroidia bacterium]|nr:T9SS type A sorting domain-containing protein [Bacteroidia bacterium]
WSANAASATTTIVNINPTATATYVVTAANNLCMVMDSVTVNVNALPTVNASAAPVAVCPAGTTTLTVSGTATTYTWSTSATTASISVTPSVTATYSVTSSIGNCSVTAVSTVTVTPSFTPTITITEFVPFAPFVNVATGGTATANNNYGGNDAMYAFDGDTVINGWGSASGGLPAWLAYDFGTGNSKIINEYSIFCSSQMTGGWGSASYDPQIWTFEGFNGTTWIILDAQIDNNPVQDIWKNYRFANSTAYQMYRINISNTQDGSYAMVTELRMGLSNVTNHNCGNQLFIAANDTSQKPFTYQWQLNGSNVGTSNDSLSLASFHQNDMLVCVLNTTAACATTNTLTSNTLTINHGPVNAIASVNGTTLTTAAVAGATYQWVNCNTGNSAIAGATNQSYVATTNGSYAVVVVTANGCADTSACASVTTVGIDNFNATSSSVTIYPNPNNGNFVVTTTNPAKTILVTDILGNEIFSVTPNNNTTTISLNTQANGIYFVKIISDNAQTVKRIVINN